MGFYLILGSIVQEKYKQYWMRQFKITDDSGFLGIINFDTYDSFIGKNWNFEIMKNRIVREMNAHHLLFWGTGFENTWTVSFVQHSSAKPSFQEFRGVIEVTNKKLFLTNYESLTMAAQFSSTKLPPAHMDNLFYELENGKYMLKIRQLFNPFSFQFDEKAIHFEIVVQQIKNMPELYKNKCANIFWSNA